MFGTGVNPSPVPDPHSFQNPIPSTRVMAGRARPIMVNAQIRAHPGAKRKKLRLTVVIVLTLDGVDVGACLARGHSRRTGSMPLIKNSNHGLSI